MQYKIFFLLRRSVSVVVAVYVITLSAAVNDSITIVVNPGERHRFGGLGATLTNLTPGGWGSMAPQNRKIFIQNTIRESRFRNLILWGNLWLDPQDSMSADTSKVSIVQSQLDILTWAQEAGVDFIMINPINDRSLPDHVSFWSQCAAMLRNRGIKVNAITFLNKANTGQNSVDSGKRRREPYQVVEGIKALRKKLDEMELNDVLIGGPTIVEWHPRTWLTYGDLYDFRDGDTAAYFAALTADDAAIAALAAIDMQSYGASMGDWIDSIARAHKKEIWISLAATDAPYEWDTRHPRGKNYYINGPIIAANCLANLNHGVSRWNYWLLMDLIQTASPTNPSFNGRYHYLANISQRFDKGAVFRRCTSNHPRLPTPDMRWNYNRQSPFITLPTQPDIIAAAACNPDTTWTVAIQNVSNLLTQHKASNDSGVARTYSVTIDIPELRDVDSLQFHAAKCIDVTGIKDGGIYIMRNGRLSVTVNAVELYVLRSEKALTRTFSRIAERESAFYNIRQTAMRGVFTVETKKSMPPTDVHIIAANGKTLALFNFSHGQSHIIDLRRLPQGMYVASFSSKAASVKKTFMIR